MTDEIWNDKSRDELREQLRSTVLGEVRLARHGHQAILEHCRDVYLQDVCPENEWKAFLDFAEMEIDRAASQLAAEAATWPNETDCDRLDRVEFELRERGILLWQVSPCCDTCTRSELTDRVDVIDGRYPGFRDRLRGYAFFIDQNMPESLAEDTHVSIYLGYGWFPSDNSEADNEVYVKNSLGIAREVCQCLRDRGFKVDWNGDFRQKICVSLNWQRRTRIE